MADEERALLGAEGGDGGGGSPGPPRALPAACDPRRLPHRLLVLALMCFLGFGAGRGRGAAGGGASGGGARQSPEAFPSPCRQLLLLRQPGRAANAGSAGESCQGAWKARRGSFSVGRGEMGRNCSLRRWESLAQGERGAVLAPGSLQVSIWSNRG